MHFIRNSAGREFVVILATYTAYFIAYFSPALFGNLLLAPGDGKLSYLEFFIAGGNSLWTDLLLGGYSMAGEIQSQLFYLPRLLSPTYNALVISAFVISAMGTYYLARTISGSRVGGIFAGLLVSSGGFMIAHLGHLTIIHSAAWIPWLLLAVYNLRSDHYRAWMCLGAVSAALSVMGGHPQIAVYGYLVAGILAAYLAAKSTWEQGLRNGAMLIGKASIMFALGIALAAPTWLPFAFSVADGARENWSLVDFASFSLTWKALILIFAPNLYGAVVGGPYGGYSGPGNLTEIAIYVGLLPWILLLALPARRLRLAGFWIGCLVLSLVYVLGTSTMVGDLVYHLPVLGKFRAQARFGIITALCMAIISAIAIGAIEKSEVSRRRMAVAGTLFVLVFGTAMAMGGVQGVTEAGSTTLARILWPMIFMGATLVLLQWFGVVRNGRFIGTCFVVLLVVDLASFGWFYDWRYAGVGAAAAHPNAVSRGQVAFMKTGGRIFPLDPLAMPEGPFRPNVNMAYGLPLVVGYVSSVPRSLNTLFEAQTYGAMSFYGLGSPSLDILGVRWLAYQGDRLGVHMLANGCAEVGKVRKIRASVPKGIRVQAIKVISSTSCSVDLPSGTAVATLGAFDLRHQPIQQFPVLLGRDTAEWSYDKPGNSAAIRHARAKVASTFGFSPTGNDGLWFVSEWPMGSATDVDYVELKMLEGQPPLNVQAVEVLTASGETLSLGLTYFGNDTELLVDSAKSIDGVRVAERPNYRGLAWGVCGMEVVDEEALLRAVRSGDMAGGRRFDPFSEVLVGSTAPWGKPTCHRAPSVEVLAKSPGRIHARVDADGKSLIVFSEHYDPGWRARVNGTSTKVIAADGSILGVPVGSGTSDVVVEFFPRGLRAGLWLCFAALLGMLAHALWHEREMLRRLTRRSTD